MKYMGSKSRVAKHIVPIIQSAIEKTGYSYWEPFCGGCNIIDKISAPSKIASDIHPYLIAMWQRLQTDTSWIPETISHSEYSDVRSHPDQYPDWYVGWVGFVASYNGRYFDGGYAKKVVTKTGVERNYYDEAKRNILEQLPSLHDITFLCCDYREQNPQNMVIYCDPPYSGAKGYSSGSFDTEKFWDTMREWSESNVVLISEQSAPDDFVCIWQQEITRTQDNRKRSKAVERLYRRR